jgi:hypothetical protein
MLYRLSVNQPDTLDIITLKQAEWVDPYTSPRKVPC